MVAHVVFSGDRVTTASVVKGNSTHIMRAILRHRNRVKGLRTPHCLLHLDLPFPSYGPRDILSKFGCLISKTLMWAALGVDGSLQSSGDHVSVGRTWALDG